MVFNAYSRYDLTNNFIVDESRSTWREIHRLLQDMEHTMLKFLTQFVVFYSPLLPLFKVDF